MVGCTFFLLYVLHFTWTYSSSILPWLTDCNCSLFAVYNSTVVPPPNTKIVAARNAFPTVTIQNENKRSQEHWSSKCMASKCTLWVSSNYGLQLLRVHGRWVPIPSPLIGCWRQVVRLLGWKLPSANKTQNKKNRKQSDNTLLGTI